MATETSKKTEKITKNKSEGPFAVIKTGGKQYVVREGDLIKVEKIADLKEGDTKITFDDVLLSDDGNNTKIGTPTVSGAKVTGELVEETKDKKVVVIRYRAKSRYFKKNGHRQPKMLVRITGIK